MGAFDYGSKSAKRVTYVNKPTTANAVGPVYLSQIKAYTLTGSAAYSTILSIEGSGAINLAACTATSATSDTIKFRVTIDGNVIYSASWVSAHQYYGVVAIGAVDSTGLGCSFQRIPFDKSAKFEISSASGLSIKCFIDYEITQ